jgi:phosphoglycerate dehydrogenase-like enzyme
MATLGTVLITAGSVKGTPAALALLEGAGCSVKLETTPSPIDEQWLIDQIRDVEGAVFAMEPVTSRVVDAATRLRIIARPGVGYDTVDVAAATRKRIAVTIAAGTNDQSVADYTLGLLLAAARGILPAAQGMWAKRWDRVTGTEVWNKTLAIVGLGRVGKAVAKRARGFDMRVLAVSRSRDEALAREHEVTFVALEDALREADFVSLHAPLTAETENLINERTLATMKRGAYLINTARGGLVDEKALADAGRSGHLAGAAVDVLRVQGAGSASPLIGEQGMIVSPHMASF